MFDARYTFKMYSSATLRRMANLMLKTPDNEKFAKRYSSFGKFFSKGNPSKPTRIEYKEAEGLFFVSDKDTSVYVARRARIGMQLQGIKKRQAELGRIYLQDCVDILDGDVVVDCGSHIGEFSIHCTSKGARTFSFEPDPQEFRALQANSATRKITPVKKALSNESGTLKFYDANDTGDSSLFDSGRSTTVLEVEATTLDAFMKENYPEGMIKLLKLEAEGAEPEILQGARETLGRIKYVAAAAGPERGVSKETTLAEVTRQLHEHNFQMIEFGSRYYVAIFENLSLRD